MSPPKQRELIMDRKISKKMVRTIKDDNNETIDQGQTSHRPPQTSHRPPRTGNKTKKGSKSSKSK